MVRLRPVWMTNQWCQTNQQCQSTEGGWLVTTLLQCFDTVGWVIRPVKTVGRITYVVLAQT